MECITTITYGQKEKWGNRNEAVAFFINCIENSEGAERNRYVNVLLDLLHGKNVCSDKGGDY